MLTLAEFDDFCHAMLTDKAATGWNSSLWCNWCKVFQGLTPDFLIVCMLGY